MTHIAVKNGNDMEIRGRFDGVDYKFPPGETVAVPVEVATHVFGFGVEDKSRAFHRLGWMGNMDAQAIARQRLAKITFEEVEQTYRPRERQTLAAAVKQSKKAVLAEGGDQL